MLTLICPGCRARLTVGDERAGQTFACPRCERALTVPLQQSTDTARADADSPSSESPKSAGKSGAAAPRTWEPSETTAHDEPPPEPRRGSKAQRPDDDDDDDLVRAIRLRRKQQRGQRILWLGGAVFLLALLVFGRFVLSKGGVARPGSGEVRADDLNELIVELHSKPGVVAVVSERAREAEMLAFMGIPPGHQTVTLAVIFTKEEMPVGLTVIDCSTSGQAATICERLKTKSQQLKPLDKTLHSQRVARSGQFVIIGDPDSMKWFGRYYTLR